MGFSIFASIVTSIVASSAYRTLTCQTNALDDFDKLVPFPNLTFSPLYNFPDFDRYYVFKVNTQGT